MSQIRKNTITAALGVLLAAAAALTPQTGQAAVTSTFSGGVLTVTASASADDVTITATGTGSNVTVNGNTVNNPDAGGTLKSEQVTGRIIVTCTGTSTAGSAGNTIDLSGVNVANGFTTPSLINTVSAGGNQDIITGSEFNDSILGGTQADTIRMSGGNDTLNGAADNDIFMLTPPAAGFTDVVIGGGGSDTVRFDTSPLFNATARGFTGASPIQGQGTGIVTYDGTLEAFNFRPTATWASATGLMTVNLFQGGASFSVSGGNVLVNGYDTVIGVVVTPTPASAVTSITLDCSDHLNTVNRVDFSGVTAVDFTGILPTGGPFIMATLGGGADVSTGSVFADDLRGEGGNDTLSGGGGNDYLNGGDGADRMNGDDGDDLVDSGNGNDTVHGGLGNDTINGNANDDILYGDEGNDSLNGGNDVDTLYGGLDNDTLQGSNQNDIVYGEEGDDVVQGGNQNDTLYGGDGNDVVVGGNNTDIIYGGPGNDQLDGQAGTDTVYGEDGDDVTTYTAGQGTQVLYGGNGYDTFNVQAPGTGATLTIDGGDPITFPGDVLNYDALNNVVVDSNPGGPDGAVTGPFVGTTNYTSIESKALANVTLAPYLIASPNPLNVYSDPFTTGTNTETVTNIGPEDLHVTSTTIADESIPGAFEIVSGAVTTTQTLPTHASWPVDIAFHDTLATANTAPATANLMIFSDSGNDPASSTIVALVGARNDDFVWVTDAVADWTQFLGWQPNGVPAAEDTASIGSGVVTRSTPLVVDRAHLTRADAVTSLALTGGELHVAHGAFTVADTGTAAFTQQGGLLSCDGGTTGNVQVGSGKGVGTYTMEGGNIAAAGALNIGPGGGNGAFNLKNGTINVTGQIGIGPDTANSRGALTIDGGSITLAGAFLEANAANCTGVVTVNGGALIQNSTGNDFNVGRANGNGTFTQNGGTVSTNRTLYIGRNGAASRGVYNLNGGSLTVGVDVLLGGHNAAATCGQGVFNATSGTVTVGSRIMVGQQNYGEMNIDGATASANAAGANVRSILIGGDDDNNYNSEGKVTVDSGSLNGAATLSLGDESASTGTLVVNGGAVSAGANLVVGRRGYGAMTMTGGSVSVGNEFRLASTGTIGKGFTDLSGGAVTVAGSLRVGMNGRGDLLIRGGADVRANDLQLGGDQAVSIGSFDMSGGSLTVNSITTGTAGTAGGWSWTGGAIAASTFTLPLAVTNAGGTLIVGGTGIGTTAFTAGTNYVQTAGAIDVEITSATADQLLLVNSAGAFNGGALNVTLLGEAPLMGASWDVVVATGAGSVAVSSVTVNLPNPTNWSVTSDSQRITVHFKAPARLSAPESVVIPDIILALGETTKTKTFEMSNIGGFALQVTSMSLSEPTSFTLLEPTTFPLTLAPRLENGATTMVTVEFAETTTGTYTATLDILNDGVVTMVSVTLRAKVTETIISASGVETWRRY